MTPPWMIIGRRLIPKPSIPHRIPGIGRRMRGGRNHIWCSSRAEPGDDEHKERRIGQQVTKGKWKREEETKPEEKIKKEEKILLKC